MSKTDAVQRHTLASLAAGLVLGALFSPAAAQPASRETTVAVEVEAPAGTSLERMAHQITPMIERHLGDAENLQFMISWTRAAHIRIVLKFKPQSSEAAALAAVRDKLAAFRARQPAVRVPDPVALAADRLPIAYLGFVTESMSAAEATRVVEPGVREAVQRIPGVAEVRISGARREVGRIHLDRARLAAYGLTVDAVRAALLEKDSATIVELLDGEEPTLVLPRPADYENLQALEHLTLKVVNGAALRLRDVARIERGARSDGVIARFDGQIAVLLEISRRPDMEAAAAVRAFRAQLPPILPSFPPRYPIKSAFPAKVASPGAEARR